MDDTPIQPPIQPIEPQGWQKDHHTNKYLIIGLIIGITIGGYTALAKYQNLWPFEQEVVRSEMIDKDTLLYTTSQNVDKTVLRTDCEKRGGQFNTCGSDGTPSAVCALTCEFKSDDASSWKTHTNEEYGFEFKHPEDWKVEISTTLGSKIETLELYPASSDIYFKNSYIHFALIPSSGPLGPGPTIEMYKEAFNSSSFICDKPIFGKDKNTRSCKVVEIGNKPGLNYEFYNSSRDTWEKEARIQLFNNDFLGFFITTTTINKDLDVRFIYDQILSTFKFEDNNSQQLSCGSNVPISKDFSINLEYFNNETAPYVAIWFHFYDSLVSNPYAYNIYRVEDFSVSWNKIMTNVIKSVYTDAILDENIPSNASTLYYCVVALDENGVELSRSLTEKVSIP